MKNCEPKLRARWTKKTLKRQPRRREGRLELHAPRSIKHSCEVVYAFTVVDHRRIIRRLGYG